jgi:hypothetical protein
LEKNIKTGCIKSNFYLMKEKPSLLKRIFLKKPQHPNRQIKIRQITTGCRPKKFPHFRSLQHNPNRNIRLEIAKSLHDQQTALIQQRSTNTTQTNHYNLKEIPRNEVSP